MAKTKKSSQKENNSNANCFFNEEQRFRFEDILIELAKDQTIFKNESNFQNILIKLENLYSGDDNVKHRHFYTDIYAILINIKNDPEKGNIDILAQNLNYIIEHYKCNSVDISKELFKLYDHVNLEIQRINYSFTVKNETVSSFNELDFKLQEAQESYRKLSDQTDKIKEEIEKNKTDNVAVLGIFASIVLAFVGAFTFSTSVLQNIKDISIYRLVSVALLIAFTFINMIWALTALISNITIKQKPKIKLPIILSNSLIVLFLIITWISYSNSFWGEYKVPESNTSKEVNINADLKLNTSEEIELNSNTILNSNTFIEEKSDNKIEKQ